MELTAISPLDGRYGNKVKQLRTIFSEFGLIRYRVLIEVLDFPLFSMFLKPCSLAFVWKTLYSDLFIFTAYIYFVQVRWIQKLSRLSGVEEVPSFSAGAMSVLEDMVTNFGVLDAAAVKKQECITNHDVKAVEYVLKEKFRAHPELSKVCFPTSFCENFLWLHFQFISLPALFSSNMSLPTKLCRNMQTGVGVYSLCLYLRGHQQFSTCSDATEGSTVYCAACNGSYCWGHSITCPSACWGRHVSSYSWPGKLLLPYQVVHVHQTAETDQKREGKSFFFPSSPEF